MARRADWARAEAGEPYLGSADDLRDGFIHFSTAAQVRDSAARHRAGQTDLLLIAVAESDSDSWRWEPARGGDLFPHLYGPLPMAAVVGVHELPLGPDGLHVFPPLA
jgi:uncharacterized protein (DUF952 family)